LVFAHWIDRAFTSGVAGPRALSAHQLTLELRPAHWSFLDFNQIAAATSSIAPQSPHDFPGHSQHRMRAFIHELQFAKATIAA
jgi:hypothetical protein